MIIKVELTLFKHKNKLLMIGSFVLPLLLLLILWTILQLAPFGDNNLLVSDLGTQYMPFLSFLKRSFHEGLTSVYSFSNEIGESVIPLAAYYLLSPFNLLVFLFSYEQLPIAVLWIITLKIALMGTSMFYYLKQTYQTSSWGTLLFSTAYSLCGFVTVYSQNFMWLDALILFPLVVLGIQHLWDEKKWGLYSITLFLAIVTNYYLGYMICLFAVIYSIYWFLKKHGTQPHPFKELLKNSRLFFVVSFFTGIATSFVLLPAAEGMLQTKKTNFDVTTFFPTPTFGADFFSQLGIGSINYELRLEHLPTIFSSLLVTTLLIAYFQMKKIATRDKIASALLLLTLFLSFWLEGFNTIWHMFQSPAGFPYRNAFMFSFLLIILAYEAFLQLQKGARVKLSAPIIVSCLLLIGYGALYFGPHKSWILSMNYLWISLVLLWLFYGLLVLSSLQKTKKYGLLLLFVLLGGELVTNFWVSLKDIPFGTQSVYEENYRQQSTLINEQLANSSDLFRMKQVISSTEAGYNEKNNGYNNPLLYGYAGVSSYTSTLTASTQDTLSALGLYQKNDRRIAYVDNSKVTNLLLDVAYEFLPVDETTTERPIKTTKQTNVFKNSEAIGMGFLVPENFGKLHVRQGQPLAIQEQILQTLHSSTQRYFTDATFLPGSQADENEVETTVKVASSGDLHLFIPSLNWSKVTEIKINNHVLSTPIYITTNQLFNLGEFEKGDLVKITLTTNQTLDLRDWQVKTLNQAAFDSVISELTKQALALTEQKNGQLKGTITVPENGNSLLYTSIPYDKKWRVSSETQENIPTKKVLGNFLALELSAGKHQLTFTYQPNTLYLGALISLLVFIGTAGYLATKKISTSRRQKRKDDSHES